jgi:hypothetical protein
MGIAGSAVAIEPPRAGRWMKQVRPWLQPFRLSYYRIRDTLTGGLPQFYAEFVRSIDTPSLTPGLMGRMCVPGWTHFYLGHGVRGAVFLAVYLPIMAYALASIGSTQGSIALGIAFGVHAASLVDLLTNSEQSLRERVLVIPLLILVSLFAGYSTIGSAISQVASTRALIRAAGPFERGDVLIYNRWAYTVGTPEPGDVVVYRVPNRPNGIRIPSAGTREATFLRLNGERIDRILAGPNSTLQLQDGKLLINGQSSGYLPLDVSRLPLSLTLSIPENHYAILLTTDAYMGADTPATAWQQFCVVPSENIVGRVYLRNYPFSRLSWVH